MIFNLWRKYPKRAPKESGWYLCTTGETALTNYENGTTYVLTLYYDKRVDKWIDLHRQSVFAGYSVYKVCRAPIEENHVWSDWLCVRHDVAAWKKLPKKFKGKGIKDER